MRHSESKMGIDVEKLDLYIGGRQNMAELLIPLMFYDCVSVFRCLQFVGFCLTSA